MRIAGVVMLLVVLSFPAAAQQKPAVAMIGTGNVGSTLGPAIAALGNPVIYGSRDPRRESVRALVVRSGPNASAAVPRKAVVRADIIILAVPGSAIEEVSGSLGDLSGKVVVDMSAAPKRQAADGYFELVSDSSNSERLQSWHPRAKVVRIMIPTAFLFSDPLALGTPPTVPIAADDREAKEAVAQIVFDIGLDPWDAGPLRFARAFDAMGLLFWVPLQQERSEGIELKLLRNSAMPCFVNITDGLQPPRDMHDLARIPQREPPMPCDAWKLPAGEK